MINFSMPKKIIAPRFRTRSSGSTARLASPRLFRRASDASSTTPHLGRPSHEQQGYDHQVSVARLTINSANHDNQKPPIDFFHVCQHIASFLHIPRVYKYYVASADSTSEPGKTGDCQAQDRSFYDCTPEPGDHLRCKRVPWHLAHCRPGFCESGHRRSGALPNM